MERLTARNENGEKEAYYPYCMREDTCDGDGASEKCDGCDFAQKVCETLASYEEMGLTPEQIRKIDRLYAEKCREVAELQQRDTPVKVKPIEVYHPVGYRVGMCPKCDAILRDYANRFCGECGQRLEWGSWGEWEELCRN